MKLRHATVGSVVFVAALASLSACAPRQKRNDWRSPPSRTATTECASDSDCPGGTCAIELGAEKGTCNGASGSLQPSAADAGGARPLAPLPNHQPSSGDIKL